MLEVGTSRVGIESAIRPPWRLEFDRETVAHLRVFGWLALQLVGLGLLARVLSVESPVFATRVIPLAFGGAIVNHLLPKQYRLSFFGLLSLTAIWLVFGLVDGAWIVGIGLVLIAFCHLPVAFPLRLALLLGTGVFLAVQRMGTIGSPWSMAIWPILGSMFMFRMVVYLYDMRHAKQRTRWEERVAYFFCLPNVAFPLFPVIDFATFRRTYYDRPSHEIYREGIRWMVRGFTHMMLYRFIYQYGTLSPAEVTSGSKLVQYVIANYGLYLRVSGQFHLIVGMLHLFGFRLPETHKFFFLASSFSDLWRRINIYWKDFMQKVFYMPVFFRLMRKHGETFALVASSVVVFIATWALHSYQWFWVLGTWLWSTTDTVFWAILAVCLVTNQLWEKRRGRLRSIGVPTLSRSRLIAHGVQTAAMFTLMCMLWSLWSSPTFADYGALLRGAVFGWRDAAVVLAVLSGVAAIAAFGYRRAHTAAALANAPGRDASALAGFAFLGALAFAGSDRGGALLPRDARGVMANVREGQLNKSDLDQLQRGYYEKMMRVNKFNGELWRLYAGKPTAPRIGFREAGIVASVDDPRLEVVQPNLNLEFIEKHLSTNSWGMRDRPYELAKPAGTWRMALFGQSYVFGSGVADGETFETIVEDRLNAERSADAPRYEILNMSVPASSQFAHLETLKRGLVERFSPDVVMLVGHRSELRQVADYLRDVERLGLQSPVPEADRLLRASGITASMSRDTAQRRILPVRDSILRALYVELAREIRRIGAIPVYAAIPTPLERQEESVDHLIAIASSAGFVTIDLSDVYRGHNEHDLVLNEYDRHPNAAGNQVIADELYRALRSDAALLTRAGSGRATERAPRAKS
jgi:D-alanyl-lipoteichoic acid acyltransferase DltB (MBOAT superfamily)